MADGAHDGPEVVTPVNSNEEPRLRKANVDVETVGGGRRGCGLNWGMIGEGDGACGKRPTCFV